MYHSRSTRSANPERNRQPLPKSKLPKRLPHFNRSQQHSKPYNSSRSNHAKPSFSSNQTNQKTVNVSHHQRTTNSSSHHHRSLPSSSRHAQPERRTPNVVQSKHTERGSRGQRSRGSELKDYKSTGRRSELKDHNPQRQFIPTGVQMDRRTPDVVQKNYNRSTNVSRGSKSHADGSGDSRHRPSHASSISNYIPSTREVHEKPHIHVQHEVSHSVPPNLNLSTYGYSINARDTTRQKALHDAITNEGIYSVRSRMIFLIKKYESQLPVANILLEDLDWMERYQSINETRHHFDAQREHTRKRISQRMQEKSKSRHLKLNHVRQ